MAGGGGEGGEGEEEEEEEVDASLFVTNLFIRTMFKRRLMLKEKEAHLLRTL